ncbi:MAG: ORF6N domain-containing protein [Clostridia bacterium]|nr:ORF6N domain-containing protein [Clostridia bacterium]
MKNNISKFDDDFRFQLTREELEQLSMSKKLISIQTKGVKGGRSKLPWAFSEAGLYMLMTILKGDLATQQSKTLIRIFQAMKEYISEIQDLVAQRDMLRLSLQTNENTEAIRKLQSLLGDQHTVVAGQQKLQLAHEVLAEALVKIGETVKQSDLSPVFRQFQLPEDQREFLLREGFPAKADVTYMDIYSKAEKSVFIIDNYINLKTLRLLQSVRKGVTVTVFSDNLRNHLHSSDYADFQVEFPSIPITFITAAGIMHDRFIILDYGHRNERFYHCGASSKDAAIRLTTAITELTSSDMKKHLHALIDQMLNNPPLVLK